MTTIPCARSERDAQGGQGLTHSLRTNVTDETLAEVHRVAEAHGVSAADVQRFCIAVVLPGLAREGGE